MRELAILTFVTLDGVMQAPAEPEEDRSGGFKHGGWAKPYWSEVMAQVGEVAMATPYDLLLGRRTYDTFAAHFSTLGDDNSEGGLLNNATKHVATSDPGSLGWRNSNALAGDIPPAVERLKAEAGPLLQVHGSWQLIQTLLAHDLIDEYRLWTFPVTVGAGKRLFADGAAPSKLKLVKSGATENGVRMGIYRRQGES